MLGEEREADTMTCQWEDCGKVFSHLPTLIEHIHNGELRFSQVPCRTFWGHSTPLVPMEAEHSLLVMCAFRYPGLAISASNPFQSYHCSMQEGGWVRSRLTMGPCWT